MKRIRTFLRGLFPVLVACFFMTACADEDELRQVQEGLPVSLKFDLTTPAPNEVKTRATDADETRVEKLALFFYRGEDTQPIVYVVPDVGAPNEVSSTNYKYSIEVPESAGLTSGDYYVYAIANWDKGFWGLTQSIEELGAMTKKEMDDLSVMKMSPNIAVTETAILLTGKYGREDGMLTLERKSATDGTNQLSEVFHLRRSLAKVNFTFENGPGVTFVPERWELRNYCKTSTLFERDGWTTKDGTVDNVNGTHAGTGLDWKGISGTTSLTNSEFLYNEDNGIFFYMPENVTKAKATEWTDGNGQPVNLSYANREKKDANESYVFAPDRGTYVVVYGKYEGPGKSGEGNVSADVKYTIFLGDFSQDKDGYTGTGSADNFVVRRNTKYKFNVKVLGVDNIITEAETHVENQPGAEGDVVVNVAANTKVFDAHYETGIIAMAKADLDTYEKFTLQLKTPAGISGNHFIEVTPGNVQSLLQQEVGTSYDWAEFIAPASNNTYVAYPGQRSENLMKLDQVLENLLAHDYSKFTVVGDSVYIQVFVNEYFYDDKALNAFVNEENRVMTVASGTSVSSDKNSSYSKTPVFSIQQKSIKSVYNLGHNNMVQFGIENVSDQEASLLFEGANTASTDEPYSQTNGFDGRANSLVFIPIGGRWDTYADFTANKMKDGYDYGAYQWLTRNRDLDGDGIIDDNEIRWYLPAINQLHCIWAGKHCLSSEAQLNEHHVYFSSSSGMNRTYWAEEGTFGEYKGNSDNENKELVRCARTLSTDIAAVIMPISSLNVRDIYMEGLNDNAIRKSGSQVGEYLIHAQDDPNNKLPQAFRVAKVPLGITAGDNHVPAVTVTDISSTETSSGTFYTYYKMTCKVTVSNRISGRKYYWSTDPDAAVENMTEIPEEGASVEMTFRKGDWSGELSQQTSIYIVAYNGNYCKITPTGETAVGTENTIITANQNSGSATKFTATQVLNDNLCKDYYEEADGSDKGQWRVPNQRELMIMFFNKYKGTYEMPAYTASRTYYDARASAEKGIYYVQNTGTFITTEGDYTDGELIVVPVRDVQPEQTTSSINVGSSYGSGGSIIK